MTNKFVLTLLTGTAISLATGMLAKPSVAARSLSCDTSTETPRVRANLVATLAIMYIPFEGDTNPQQAMLDRLNREQLDREQKKLNPSEVITDTSGKKHKSNSPQEVMPGALNIKQLNEEGTFGIMYIPLN